MTTIHISSDPEALFIAKSKLERFWLEEEEIDGTFTLEDFISYIDLDKYVYYTASGHVIPFSLQNTQEEDFLFVVDDGEDERLLIEALEDIDYNLFNLIAVSQTDMYVNNLLEDKPFFIINGKPALPKKSYIPSNKISANALSGLNIQITKEDMEDILQNGVGNFRHKVMNS
jgi:hypothetical protein